MRRMERQLLYYEGLERNQQETQRNNAKLLDGEVANLILPDGMGVAYKADEDINSLDEKQDKVITYSSNR